MELLQLKYFYEAAKLQHISNTAKKLNVAQPSITQSIHRLESELGVKLFRASGRNIVLTEYGIYLRDRIAPVINILDSLPEEIADMANLNKNTIKLNVMAASTVLTSALIEYQKLHDNIKFMINQTNESETADIDIFTQPFYQKTGKTTYVFSEQIFLAVPRKSAYSELDSIFLENVRNENFISLAGSKALRQICDRFCMHSGFTPKIIFESDSPAAVRNLIGAHMGIGFWPQYTWGSIDETSIKLLPIKSPICQRDIVIKCNGDQNKKEVLDFFEFLKNYFERLNSY